MYGVGSAENNLYTISGQEAGQIVLDSAEKEIFHGSLGSNFQIDLCE